MCFCYFYGPLKDVLHKYLSEECAGAKNLFAFFCFWFVSFLLVVLKCVSVAAFSHVHNIEKKKHLGILHVKRNICRLSCAAHAVCIAWTKVLIFICIAVFMLTFISFFICVSLPFSCRWTNTTCCECGGHDENSYLKCRPPRRFRIQYAQQFDGFRYCLHRCHLAKLLKLWNFCISLSLGTQSKEKLCKN